MIPPATPNHSFEPTPNGLARRQPRAGFAHFALQNIVQNIGTQHFYGGVIAFGIAAWSNFSHEKPSQLTENLRSGESLWDAYREPKSSSLARSQIAMFLLG